MATLAALFHEQYDEFRGGHSDPRKLLAVGDAPIDPAFDVAECAAMTVLATTDALLLDLRHCLGGDPGMVARRAGPGKASACIDLSKSDETLVFGETPEAMQGQGKGAPGKPQNPVRFACAPCGPPASGFGSTPKGRCCGGLSRKVSGALSLAWFCCALSKFQPGTALLLASSATMPSLNRL